MRLSHINPLLSNWGKYAAGSAAATGAAAGVTGACLFLGPPGWVAAAGLMSAAGLASIAYNIGLIAQSKYQNHKEKVESKGNGWCSTEVKL